MESHIMSTLANLHLFNSNIILLMNYKSLTDAPLHIRALYSRDMKGKNDVESFNCDQLIELFHFYFDIYFLIVISRIVL